MASRKIDDQIFRRGKDPLSLFRVQETRELLPKSRRELAFRESGNRSSACRLGVCEGGGNEIENKQLIEKEIFNEIINLIHCFSMKMYSSRRKEKLKLIEKDLSLEHDFK